MIIIDDLKFPNATFSNVASFEVDGEIKSMQPYNLQQRSNFYDFWKKYKDEKVCFMLQEDGHIFLNHPYILRYNDNNSVNYYFSSNCYFRYCILTS